MKMTVVEEEPNVSPNWLGGYYIDGDPVAYADLPASLRKYAERPSSAIVNPAENIWLKQRVTNPQFFARQSNIGTAYKIEVGNSRADRIVPLVVIRVPWIEREL